MLHLHLSTGEVIRTTAEHPFWVDGHGWTPAEELEVGDRLRSYSGEVVTVAEVLFTDEVERVYNARIAEYHTYYVRSPGGTEFVWAHNACRIVQNSAEGLAREVKALAILKQTHKGAVILAQRTLRNQLGKKVVDFISKQGRRVDFVVARRLKNGFKAIASIEVTSKTAKKSFQVAKEFRIRQMGGHFIREPNTRQLIDISKIFTTLMRLA